MITINTLEFNAEFTSLHLVFDVDATTEGNTELYMYVGDCYLSGSMIDLTSSLGVPVGNTFTVDIPITEVYDPNLVTPVEGNCGYTKAIYDGIFTIYIKDPIAGNVDEIEKAIMNAYSVSLCMAHKILDIDNIDKFNETNLIYLLPEAATVYIEQGLITQALEAYNKAVILCESEPATYFETDVSTCSKGLGCWIVNGVYVKK